MKLARREKTYLFLGTICTLAYLTVQFIVFPLIDRNKQLENEVRIKSNVLKELILLKDEYEIIKQKAHEAKERYSKRKRNFRLFTFLDRLAGDVGIKDNVEYMKPSSTREKDSPYTVSLVEMKLKNINTEQLVSYLHKVEKKSSDVKVRRVLVKDSKKKTGYIDVELKVVTLEMEKE